MKRAYKAIIHSDRIEWLDVPPENKYPLEVSIVIGEEIRPGEDDELSKPVSQYLQALADMGTFAEIEDPVAWQREIRKDRPLPGRE